MTVSLALGVLAAPALAGEPDYKDPSEYDEVLDNLGAPQPWPTFQFAPDTTEIWSPIDPKSPFPRLVGHLATTTELPDYPYGDVTETWIVYRPDLVLTSPMEGHFVGPTPGGAAGLEAHYASQPDAAFYRVLEFDFRYQFPLTPAQVAQAPGLIPSCVDGVYQFAVYTEVDGVPTRSGSLYRQHVVSGSDASWWDEWVLFDTYELPDSAHVVTRLVPTGAPPVSIRAWLESQPPNQKAFVHTTSVVHPL